mgnify:CR=1 FL=1
MNKKIKKNLSFTQELFKIECINNMIAVSFLLFYNLLAFRVFEDFDVKVFFHFLSSVSRDFKFNSRSLNR